MPSVKVSVIVPVYNQQAYLTQCLESLQNQTLREIEILCVNDGSTDESWSLMQEFAARDSRFVLLNQPNQGTGRARNAALARARGEYVGFVDGDDFVDADYFESQGVTVQHGGGNLFARDQEIMNWLFSKQK